MTKYNKKCCVCNIILSKDEFGLNLKLLGDIDDKYCIRCMAEYFDVTVEDLKDRIEEFKSEGCELFD